MTRRKKKLRTFDNFSYRDRIRIAANWANGRYKETVYFQRSKMFATQIHVERGHLFVSNGSFLRIHKRQKGEAVHRKHQKEICSDVKSDISTFVKKNKTLFAGRTCGSCFIYEDECVTEERLHSHKEYLNSVDFIGDLYLTTTDKMTRLWARDTDLGFIDFELLRQFDTGYKCVKFSGQGDRFFGGIYSDKRRRALHEIDAETGTTRALNSKTFSIYDLKLKDENVLFTANYDTTFRMFDRRTNCDESVWIDPFDSSIYCLEYDGLYSVLCGMKHHCRVNLYDIRMQKDFVQIYFPSLRRTYGSPVYSLACDSRYLFIATDLNIRVFDFKADWAACKNYRGIHQHHIRITPPPSSPTLLEEI